MSRSLLIHERIGLVIPDSMDYQGILSVHDKTLLMLNAECLYRNKLESWLAEEGGRLGKMMEFGTMEGLLGCVRAGIGYAVLPLSYFTRMNVTEGIRIYPFPEKYAEVPTVFIRRRDLYMTSAFREFIEEPEGRAAGSGERDRQDAERQRSCGVTGSSEFINVG